MTEQDQTPPQDEDAESHVRKGRPAERKDDDDTKGHGRSYFDPATGDDDDSEGHSFRGG